MQVVTRSQWGARYSDGFGPAPIPTEWWLHHSAGLMPDLTWLDTDRDGVDDDEQRVMRQLEQTGQTRFSGGISYTWLVPPSGRPYVGHSMNRQGAHTRNRNDRARGICLIGNYSVYRPTSAQLDTVAEIMVTEWRAGRARTYELNGGHRDLGSTECPGDHAYALIPEINRRAKALTTGDDDMSAEAEKLIRDIHREVTQRLPARSAYAQPPWSDTLLGTTLNAEGRAHEAITELRALVAGLPRMIRDEVRAVLAEERKP